METLLPKDEKDLQEVFAAALANEEPVDVVGQGSKSALGRPMTAQRRIGSQAMTGVSLFEPAELVLTAGAGTPLREIVNLLDQQGQQLAFEPIDYGPLFGREPQSGTIGGLAATNAAGPRRIKAGAARDHLLGFKAVSGRGDVFKSGGRVMKNVTGYDLSKLMTGSYGTLAVLTEVTFKVLPKAETEETLLFTGLEDGAAVAVMTEASGLPHEVSSLAHLPSASAASLPDGLPTGASLTALRLEGPAVSVAKRKDDVISHFKAAAGEPEALHGLTSERLWAALRDVVPLAGQDAQVWRLSTAPTEGAALVEAIRAAEVPVTGWFYDWAGGLIWLAVERASDAHAAAIRAAVETVGGHATLIRADDDVRSVTPVFHPQPAALAALTARIKNSFDPAHILNRGRMRDDF